MGDRYELDLDCAYCKAKNFDIWYAPTCGNLTFDCFKCGKRNFVTMGLSAIKMEDVTYDCVEEAISGTSSMMNDKQIKRCAKEMFKKLKGGKDGKNKL